MAGSLNEVMIIENMSWPLEEVHHSLCESLFDKVPNEIIRHIFQLLPVRDLCRVSVVCRLFKLISDHDEIWKSKCGGSRKLHSKSYRQMWMQWTQEKICRKRNLSISEGSYSGETLYIVIPPLVYPRRPVSEYQFEKIGGFTRHPNSAQDMTIEFSMDIGRTARELIILLEKASPFREQWRRPMVLKQMIQRYSRFMQLKASHPSNTLLVPTLDIEIVWQTHLLRPEMYRNDCRRLFGQVIDHWLITENEIERFFKEQGFLDTCDLYEQKFGEKYCSLPILQEKKKSPTKFLYDEYELMNTDRPIYSYWDKSYFTFLENITCEFENLFSFAEDDLIFDGKWLDCSKQFLFEAFEKVRIRGHRTNSQKRIDLGLGTLKRLMKSYERFLYMAVKYPRKDANGFIPPTYAIDMIWHSHMQEPLNYEADCRRLVGYVVHHDPWSIVEDEEMKKACDQIWESEFQCERETDHLYNTSENKDTWFG